MNKFIAILSLAVLIGLSTSANAQAVPATGTNRLCWIEANDGTLQGFKIVRGAAAGVTLTTAGAVVTDVGLGVTPTSAGIVMTVPPGSTGYCAQTFAQMGVPNGTNYFFNIVSYNAAGNSALNGEVQVSPLVVTPPSAPVGLLVK